LTSRRKRSRNIAVGQFRVDHQSQRARPFCLTGR
jgi:hypothetical protein